MEEAVTRAEYMEHNKRMEDEHARQNKRLEKLEKVYEQNNKLLVSIEKMAMSMEDMKEELKDQGERLEKLESEDGKKWRNVTDTVIKAIIGALIGFVLAKIGL